MKHQHNELPLMKNQQTRRKTPKVAPLLALALVLLTIIPIYYPYIQYYLGRSPVPPSSSSSLCQDDLSGDISDCSHPNRDGNLVDANQRLATTEDKHASTSDNANVETQPSNHDSRNEAERSKNEESGTDVEGSATTNDDANVERRTQSNTGVERSVGTNDETSPEKWTTNEESNTDAERSTTTTTTTTTGFNGVERSASNDEANVERSATTTTTTTDDNAVEMSATTNDETSDDRSTATTDRDNDRERSATTTTTTGFNDVVKSASNDEANMERSATTNDETSGDRSITTTDRDNDRERSDTTTDESNAEKSATSTTTSDRDGERSAAINDETNSYRQIINEESSTSVEGGGTTTSNESDAETQEKNQENPSTGDIDININSNLSTKNATKLAKPAKPNKQGRKELPESRKKVVVTPPVDKKCDLFSGEWVPDPEGPYYTNLTCREIQEHQNCMKFGRPDTQYLKWKWKPDSCELPIFDPFQFLEIVRGKSLAFVGDSVARNHMQSLICLLSRVEEPVDISDVPYGSQFKRYQYINYNFTIEIFWSPYLVRTTQTDEQNSSPFNLYLDEFDEKWTTKIEPFDYVIISAGHWFFRPTMFYVEGNLVGCLYCEDWVNIKHLTTYFSYRRAFRTAFRAINSLENYKGITFLRTFAPSHFEGGYWNSGGNCPRKKPFKRSEGRLEGYNNELYKIQTDEIKIANRMGRRKRLRYRLFDVTQAMLLRPDGHPSQYGHWPQANVSLTNDCVHWCLPGPVDAWNDFLLELLKREEVH